MTRSGKNIIFKLQKVKKDADSRLKYGNKKDARLKSKKRYPLNIRESV